MRNKLPPFVSRFTIAFVLMISLTWVAYMLLGKPASGVDDAYIFFKYGKNIANGDGFVYNPGGERVEGFSSVLWQVIVSSAFIFTRHPQFWLQALSLLMISGSIAALWYFIDEGTAVTSRGILLLVWVFGSPSFIIWTGLTLMDTALWSSLLILGTIATLTSRPAKILTLLVPLIVLTRPEGMLWGLVFIALRFLLIVSQNGVRSSWQAIKWPLVSYLVALIGLIGWRLWYFGYPLPNTYYAKVSPNILYNLVQGAIYLRDFLIQNPYAALMALGASFSILILNFRWAVKAIINPPLKRIRGKAIITALIVLIGLLVPIWTGGDHFKLFRFYQAVWPILLLPTFALLDLQGKQIPRNQQNVLLIIVIFLFLILPHANWFQSKALNEITPEFKIAETGQQVGTQLSIMFTQKQPSIGVITAGGISYTYEGHVIDVMGLNNAQMAHTAGLRYGKKNHAAFNQEIFFKQLPQLFLPEIVSGNVAITNGCPQQSGDLLTWPNSVLNGMLSEKIFWQKYTRGVIDQTLLSYIDKNYLNTLSEHGFTVTLLGCDPY